MCPPKGGLYSSTLSGYFADSTVADGSRLARSVRVHSLLLRISRSGGSQLRPHYPPTLTVTGHGNTLTLT
jgi:hypothetical protein